MTGSRPAPEPTAVPEPVEGTSRSNPANRSAALQHTERITRTHPVWAGYEMGEEGRPSLRTMSAESLHRDGVQRTQLRLEALGRQRASGHWDTWAADLRERGAAIRRETLADLPGHLDRLTAQLESHGVVVHRVGSAEAAATAVGEIALAHGVELVAKSKSMATEEIELTRHLNGLGIDVVETDLGEYIAQVVGDRPSHIVGPALHMSRADVTEVFSDLAGQRLQPDPDELAGFARARLRADFEAADMGICGVNFAAADTGTLVVVSNEGNVDMVTSQPDLLVAVMPVEKVIPRLSDAGVLVPLLCDTANKEFTTAYQTLVTGPRRDGEADGPREMHVVIFDNGRLDLLGTPQEEVLACIRCGNCQFGCPVFRTMGGGHAYGATYGGPIGIVLTPLLGTGKDQSDLGFLCSLCGACADACPVKIPLPDLIVAGRAAHEQQHASPVERAGWRVWSEAWSRPAVFGLTGRIARVGRRMVPDALLGRLPLVSRWAAGRALPAVASEGRPVPADSQGPVAESVEALETSAEPVEAPEPVVADAADPEDPAIAQATDLVDEFCAAAGRNRMAVVRVPDAAAVPEAVARLIGDASCLVDDRPLLAGVDRSRIPDNPWQAQVGVGQARWAAAESGTLVLVQQAGAPRRTSLLPQLHVVVLDVADLRPTYQSVVDEVAALDPPPTGVQFVSGASRSGDIESAMVHGMHGPRRVAVVLVGQATVAS